MKPLTLGAKKISSPYKIGKGGHSFKGYKRIYALRGRTQILRGRVMGKSHEGYVT